MFQLGANHLTLEEVGDLVCAGIFFQPLNSDRFFFLGARAGRIFFLSLSNILREIFFVDRFVKSHPL